MNRSVKEVIVNELHRPARKIYPRRKTIVKGIDDLWQADLVDMSSYSRINRGYKYLLTVIDVFSKYAWAEPIKRKTGEEVTKALQHIFHSSKRVPKNIQTDLGKEFYNLKFNALVKKYNINHYSTYSNMKAAICERFNRTLKNKIWKNFSLLGAYKYVSFLPEIMKSYNSSYHRTIGMKPKDVNSKEIENKLLQTVYSSKRNKIAQATFKVGDYVRISKNKTVFTKGYLPNFSTEVFKIIEVKQTSPRTYLLEDMHHNPIKGGFYFQELQRVKYPDIFLIEKVLYSKGPKLYVKYLGLDEYEWIDKKNLIIN